MRKLPVIGFAAIAMVMAICCVAIAADISDDITPTAVDAGQLADFMANEVLDLQDLAEGADVQRRMFDRMTPPGLIWTQPMYPPVVPFDTANFDKTLLDSLPCEEQNSVAVYPLSLALDPKTRETFVYNAEGKQIATIPAGKSMPGWPADADPARVTLQLSLLPVKDVEHYLYTEDRITETAVAAVAKSAKYPRKGSPATKSLGASEFGICNIQHLTNGNFLLTVTNGEVTAEIYSYTVLHTSAVAVITWTNEQSNVVTDTNTVWTPVTPPFNGIESAWVVVTTNLALTNGVGVGEDTNVSSNDRVRFYAVANRLDTDEDGLSDGTEILLHRTDPNLADTDSDSIPDGAEIYLGLNPLNAADAGEDPDYDELTCREEWELGTDINISNVVQIMYFVDQIPPARMQSSTNAALYYTWTNMQAKAVYSGRLKTGNLEFSSTNLPSSDYPRYYLDRILTRDYINTYSSRTPTWVETYTYTNSWLVHNRYSLQGSNCILSLADSVYGANGFGSRDFYSEEFIQCRGIRIDHHDYGYYQPQPSNTLLVNEVDVYNSDCSSWTNEHLVAINTALSFTLDQSNTISHTLQQSIFQDQGGYSMGEGCTNSWEEIDVRSIILTNEYSDTVLRAHTDDDMQCLNNWAGLEWGQYIYHPYQYLTPQIYTLLPSNIRSYYYLDGNHTWNGLQALRYRWNISTGSGVVHRLIWWEQYIPDNSNQMTTISQKIINLLGTGGVNSTTNIDLPPPSVQGSIYPVPMNDVLKVEIENVAPRDTDDIQVQYFTNNAGTFTYTAIPLEIYYTISPTNGWTPDEVELHIKNPAGSTVRTITLSNNVGQQQTTWDGKDDGGDYVANGSNFVVEIAATIGSTTCTGANGLTVYEIRQGDCVYRPITLNEHAAILYEYHGSNRLADIQNDNNYTVMEHPGTGGITGPSIYGNFNNWIGAFCPPGLSRMQRKAILEKAHALDNANIPYVSFPYLSALTYNDAAGSPGGTDWAGTVGDILRIRCDGTVEVAYEDVGERLYGGNAWWSIMAPGAGTGSNLALHNDGSDSLNPNRQRDGINAVHDLTQNRADAIHLP